MSVTPNTASDLDASFVIVDSDSKQRQQQPSSWVGDILSNLRITD